MRHSIPSGFIACLLASMAPTVRAQEPPAMPSWLAVYPGAAAQTRESAVLVESTYTAAARPHEVVDHYRQLFQSVGVPFRPVAMGYGFMIRAATDACELSIQIRNQNTASAVRVTCAALNGRRSTSSVLDQAEKSHEKAVQSMEKYDQPVYPQPKVPGPAPAWPPWLVHLQGAHLKIQTGAIGQIGYLKSTFTSELPLATIQSFYADLLGANGYRVAPKSNTVLNSRRAWVEGDVYPDGRPGPRVVIRVDITAVNGGSSVELRVTGFR
jgi:hypothetical protein